MSDPDLKELVRAILPPGSSDEEIDETFAIFDSTGIEVLSHEVDSRRYPRLTRGPRWDFLTAFGDPSPLDSPTAIAIVGRRDPSDEGLQFAHDLAEALGLREIPTLSGMARGIDQAAHQGSLSVGASTIAAIPEGLLRFLRRNKPHYPSLHAGGDSPLLAISGVAPWERWNVGEAMRRNRWIASWCDALIVVEANPEGGTWRTAEAAAEQGKPIWVCKGFDGISEEMGNEQLAKTYGGMELDIRMKTEESTDLILSA
ncbi:MAG: DNA-processing protein DprA [Candidatus Omnitrophica bacterium]|nr:DNA-processing protein DprA [Candidatus Omnitrophota bacterium]MCA9430639.1 DNA-processing protein DprA [Candidatus Omnitrophota bacterium]MCA9443979.1 DNA-processing protein DprA [Candidatus Omnitrophota bacterium]